MKTSIFQFLFILTAINTIYSQDKGSFELQVIVNTGYSYRYLDTPDDFSVFNELEKGMIGYEAGLQIAPIKNRGMSFVTGILYSRMGYSLGSLVYSAGPGPNDPIEQVKANHAFSFIEIPLMVTIRFREASRSYLIGGISNYLLLNHSYKFSEDLDFNFPSDPPIARTYNPGIKLGLGYQLVKSDKFIISAEPNIKYQLLHYGKNDYPAKRHLYNIGLTVNTQIKL